MTKVLEVKNLVVSFKTYLGRIQAVQNISFSVEEGETVAIVGESGCGKSVTAHAIIRLIPSPPGVVEGSIIFENQDLLKIPKKDLFRIRSQKIGMIFQDPMTALNPTMSCGKQIIERLKLESQGSFKQYYQTAITILERLGISDASKRLQQYPYELSGGMRQRVIIAIALACNPKLLIADEPTTALDVTIQAKILELIKTIQKDLKTSIILITHDLGLVAGQCDRVIVMYAGKIVETGSVSQIFSHPQHPYTQGLLRSIPRLDMNKNEQLNPIRGSLPTLFSTKPGCAFSPRCPAAMRICTYKSPQFIPLDSTQGVACWLQKTRTS